MTDEDLLRRFAALKGSLPGSSTDAGPSKPSNWTHHIRSAAREAEAEDEALERIADGRPVDPDSAWGDIRGDREELEEEERLLRGRLGGLRGGYQELDVVAGENEDIDVEAFIASLSAKPPDHIKVNGVHNGRSSMGDSADMEIEVGRVLGETRHLLRPPSSAGTASSAVDGADEGDEEEETEEDILEKALAEARLEQDIPRVTGSADIHIQPVPSQVLYEEDDVLFPSIPAHQPIPTSNTDDPKADEELEKRMALLLGLSGPSSRPGTDGLPSVPKSKPVKPDGRSVGQGYNLPDWNDGRDEDLDSWCCICSQDATVRCDGCDGDLYCDECWKDGHGPGGEVGHRARKFTWTKQRWGRYLE